MVTKVRFEVSENMGRGNWVQLVYHRANLRTSLVG